MATMLQMPETVGANSASVALIGPHDDRRRVMAGEIAGCQGCTIREFCSYSPSFEEGAKGLNTDYDVVFVDLDSNPDSAIAALERLSSDSEATLIVYSRGADADMVVRCMRAGAREFLRLPLANGAMAEALIRVAARRPGTRSAPAEPGKLFVFLGAKGGSGTTTVACNFAVCLVRETSKKTLLIDLDLPLGDAALDMGVNAQHSTVNALEESHRLDPNFLSTLLVQHSSGLYVLASPGAFPEYVPAREAIEKLMGVARQGFDHVVVDAGSRLDLTATGLYQLASKVYLVTQAGIPELRNSNRLVSSFFSSAGPKLEIVLNRFSPDPGGIDEEHVCEAITRPVDWKIPSDYVKVRQMQNTATPLALEDSAISRVLRQMARSAAGLPMMPERRKGFRLFK